MSSYARMWFGTEDKMQWIDCPLQGADVSPLGWSAEGTLLNGGGYAKHSWASHRNYVFEWRQSSARRMAQIMHNYRDGVYGRGLIHFVDPLTMDFNVLPKQWAYPALMAGEANNPFLRGTALSTVATPTNTLNLPIQGAVVPLGSLSGFRAADSVFIPRPENKVLQLWGLYTTSGNATAGVYAIPVNDNGTNGTPVRLTPTALNGGTPAEYNLVTGKGVRLCVMKTSSAAGVVNLFGLVGRLADAAGYRLYDWTGAVDNSTSTETGDGVTRTNLVTNPRAVASGTMVTIRTNLNVASAGNNARTHPGYTALPGPGYVDYTATSDLVGSSSGSTIRQWATGYYADFAPGDPFSMRIRIENAGTIPFTVNLGVIRTDTATIPFYYSPPQTLGSGEVREFEWSFVAGETFSAVRVALGCSSAFTIPGGAVIRIWDGWTLERGPSSPSLFSGATQPGNVDPDMSGRWDGTPGASFSYLEGRAVRGTSDYTINGGNYALIQSNQWPGGLSEGMQSVRVMNIGGGSGGIGNLNPAGQGIPGEQTAAITVWNPEGHTSFLTTNAVRVATFEGDSTTSVIFTSDQIEQLGAFPGTGRTHADFTDTGATGSRIQVATPSTPGGSIWVLCPTIVEGEHPDLMPFHGSMPFHGPVLVARLIPVGDSFYFNQ